MKVVLGYHWDVKLSRATSWRILTAKPDKTTYGPCCAISAGLLRCG